MVSTVVIHETGRPEVLQFEHSTVETPGAGEVWLEQKAVGLNPLDLSQRSGAVRIPLPCGLGLEGAGQVKVIGPGMTMVAVGDRVAYAIGPLGAYASARLYPADRLVKIGDDLGYDEAAALLFKGITAHYLLKTTYPVGPDTRVLLYGAAGALGQIMVPWAKHLGAVVIGVVSKPGSVERAKAAGYDALPAAMGRLWLGAMVSEFALAYPRGIAGSRTRGTIRRHRRRGFRCRNPHR
ncbi:hypothetical protein PS838_05021 [Pseudomonas fluorescens]|nr:hypothetical protein PS838_05021 [Pseudomonas fluorescens]